MLYCILFVFMLALLCFCVATEFSVVNKDLYVKVAGDQIDCVPAISKVGRDASHRSNAAVAPMTRDPIYKISYDNLTIVLR